MKKTFVALFLSIIICCGMASAQKVQKSELQQQAEAAANNKGGSVASARYLYIRAFEDYAGKNKPQSATECAVKAAAMYYKENYYKEAFDLLRRVDQNISASQLSESEKAALRYLTTKEHMQMYMRLKKGTNVKEQLNIMENFATQSGKEDVRNDMLYNKAVYYYTFGQNAQGNAVFKELSVKLTAQKEYDKVDEVYRTLISSACKSGSSNMVAQSYNNYIAWKDSVSALKVRDEIGALKQQIADNESSIAEKDSKLSSRWVVIIGLCVLLAALSVALVLGGIVLIRFILRNRKQKKTIRELKENNALKAKFISNISAQLEPTLQKLDERAPEVRALLDFSKHIQVLSELENNSQAEVERTDVSLQPFAEGLMNEIRDQLRSNVTLTMNVPKLSVSMNREYVAHILSHLLRNAALYTHEGGKIELDFMKRSAHTCQFLVSDNGPGIPEEKREDVFKPFLEIRDLTTGDGLGLPICRQMALNMGGELEIDSMYNKGTRFVLKLQM